MVLKMDDLRGWRHEGLFNRWFLGLGKEGGGGIGEGSYSYSYSYSYREGNA